MSDIMNFLSTLDLQSLGIGGFAGAIIGAFLNHWLSKLRSKHERVISASKEFRNAFYDELSKLIDSDEDPVSILQPAYSKHKAAVDEFLIYLGSCHKRKLLELWNAYAFHPQNIGIPFLEQYSKHSGDVNTAKINRRLAIKRLQNLIAYAKQN